jgi:pimeloyl-ACP methyl ester carboxylesterase
MQRLMLEHESMASLQRYPDALTLVTTIVRDYLAKTEGWHFMNRDPVTPIEGDLTNRLAEIKCPTQILVGKEGYGFSNEAANFLKERIGETAHVQSIEGCGHLLNIEKPDIINEAIIKNDREGDEHKNSTGRISIVSILL